MTVVPLLLIAALISLKIAKLDRYAINQRVKCEFTRFELDPKTFEEKLRKAGFNIPDSNADSVIKARRPGAEWQLTNKISEAIQKVGARFTRFSPVPGKADHFVFEWEL